MLLFIDVLTSKWKVAPRVVNMRITYWIQIPRTNHYWPKDCPGPLWHIQDQLWYFYGQLTVKVKYGVYIVNANYVTVKVKYDSQGQLCSKVNTNCDIVKVKCDNHGQMVTVKVKCDTINVTCDILKVIYDTIKVNDVTVKVKYQEEDVEEVLLEI